MIYREKGYHNGKVRVEISLQIQGLKKYLKWPDKVLRYLSPVLMLKPFAMCPHYTNLFLFRKSSLENS